MNKWISNIITLIISVASPALVQELRITIANLLEKAKQTPNPWDDALYYFLQLLVGKPGDTVPDEQTMPAKLEPAKGHESWNKPQTTT